MWIQASGIKYSVILLKRWRETPKDPMVTELKLDKPLRHHCGAVIEDASENMLVGMTLNESGYCRYRTEVLTE